MTAISAEHRGSRGVLAASSTSGVFEPGETQGSSHAVGDGAAAGAAGAPPDLVLTDTRAPALVTPGSFEQLFTTVDPGCNADLSDHCPIAVVFETDGVIEPGDVIAVLLDRLQVELEEIRAGIAALRE